MSDLQQTRNAMLADLNEVQLDLAIAGNHKVSEKVRKVKLQMLRIGGIEVSGVDALVSGYRSDAIEQCDRLSEILAKIGNGAAPSDNELMFVKMAAELLAQRIAAYMRRKMVVECPNMLEVING
jgi:hypothetical protein